MRRYLYCAAANFPILFVFCMAWVADLWPQAKFVAMGACGGFFIGIGWLAATAAMKDSQ